MSGYDFSNLAPVDFELLCCDLLSKKNKIIFHPFKPGKDKGIDLRGVYTDGSDLIVQCKHYCKSGFSKLFSNLKNNELPKVKKLRPSRYAIATSVPLSPDNQSSIAELFKPYCKGVDYVFGQEALNALLRKYPSVEKNHFKLWLTSVPLLERILNNKAFVRTIIDEEEIRNKLRLYVDTGATRSAMDLLTKTHCCIIAGAPGIGKTTLAQILMIHHLKKDWKLVSIGQNIAEGLQAWSSDSKVKQIFYYDDFLGQISEGDKLSKNEDRDLGKFLRYVHGHPNRRLILTTREYILEKAKQTHEVLNRTGLESDIYILKLNDYSRYEKAKVLANHLYFYGVSQDFIQEIVQNQTYEKIIDHRNFVPRIIEWMTEQVDKLEISPSDYPAEFLRHLDHPERIWAHAYDFQISEAGRHLIQVLCTLAPRVDLDDLKKAFIKLYQNRAQDYGFSTHPNDFEKALKELDGTFLKTQQYRFGVFAETHNPSVLDFFVDRLRKNEDDLAAILANIVYWEQIIWIGNVYSEGQWVKGSLAILAPYEDIILDTLKKTMRKPSVKLGRIHYGNGSSVLSKYQRFIADTMESLIRFSIALNSTLIRDYVCNEIKKLVSDIQPERIEMHELVGLLSKAQDAVFFNKEEMQRLNLSCRKYIEHELYSVDAARAMAIWVDEYSDSLDDDEKEQASDIIRTYLVGECKYNLDEYSDVDQLEYLKSNMQEIFIYIGGKSDDLEFRIEERIAEIESEEVNNGEWENDRYYSSRSSHSNIDIDSQ